MKKISLPLVIAAFAVFTTTNLFAQDNEKIIKDYISQNKLKEYKKSDLTTFIVEGTDNSSSLKGEVVRLQQTYNGLPVYGASATALIKDKKIVHFIDNFVKSYTEASQLSQRINKDDAFKRAIAEMNLIAEDYKIIDFFAPDLENQLFAKQRLVYAKKGEQLALTHEFSFDEKNTPNHWNILVDATTGEIISKDNLNLSCNFSPEGYSRDYSNAMVTVENNPGNHNKAASFLLSPDNASYNIYPLPIESPSFGNRSVINNPWDITASPEGWHSDGLNRYTITRGNNVHAYADMGATNSVGYSPDGGPSRNFDFPLNINSHFLNYEDAAITNLFYMNNKMHDIFYKFGFNEANRNFQINNFNNGAFGNDAVNAEARDGGSYLDSAHMNNANFNTPADGSKPRMQMYMWDPKVTNRLFYNTPAALVTRTPDTRPASFGPALDPTGVTGDIKISTANACSSFAAGTFAGKIALVGNTGCAFAVKTKNLQNAGAVGVVMHGTNLISLGGADATITIPTIAITTAEAQAMAAQINTGNNVNVTLRDDPSTHIHIDGDLDNGVIAHEYGHGISNRMTGTGYNCLSYNNANEQMGEGWSDFFALMLTTKPGDNPSIARAMATFVSGQEPNGPGIRPAKYSPDFTVNNKTYAYTNGLTVVNNSGVTVPDVHSIGFVWASMLWDLNWKYVEKYGYNADVLADRTSGSARVLQLVTDALKLQGCNPNFITGRDAILAADQATTGGADRCMIWNVFARRGLGVGANPGLTTPVSTTNATNVRDALSDQVEDFTVPTDCALGTQESSIAKNDNISIHPNPAKNEFYINFLSNTLGKVNVEVYDMSGKLITTENKVAPDSKKAFSTDKLQNGVYLVKVNGVGIEKTTKLIIKK